MRLLRLLAAGKSLIGIKDKSGRYRVAPGNALPKFTAASNPFRGTVKPSGVRTPEPAQQSAGDESVTPVPADGEPVKAVEPEPAPTGIPAPVCLADKRAEKSRIKRMVACLWPKSGKIRTRGVGGTSRRAIQGELQLDQVKVVRNDLSETDWDVVRQAARPVKGKETAAPGDETSARPVIEAKSA